MLFRSGRLSKAEIERMVNDAVKFEGQDKAQRERVEAKNGLENYAFSMKNTVNDANVGGKLDEADKKTILDNVESALQWLQNNQEASKEEFEHRQKELESVWNPIISKCGKSGCGQQSTPNCGTQPHIEEVF